MTTFTNGFINKLPGVYTFKESSLGLLLGMFNTSLIELIYEDQPLTMTQVTDKFDDVMGEVLLYIVRDYIGSSAPVAISNLHASCISNKLNDLVNETVKTNIVSSLYDLSLILHLLNNITKFYSNDFVQSITNTIPPSYDCVNRFISLQCGACSQMIPELCHSVCDQLIQGCYSSHRIGLNNELNILWNVTEQLVTVIESRIQLTIKLVENPVDLLSLNLSDTIVMRSFVSTPIYTLDIT